MAEATGDGEGATPLDQSLPDEIVIWEVLVRLPPKSLLRCRAVCRAWSRATSTRDFLVAHHVRQPNLPLVCDDRKSGIDVVPFDHQAGVAADGQLQPLARLDTTLSNMVASCDGLLLLSDDDDTKFSICNPTTRQYAPLHQLDDYAQYDEFDFTVLAMYPHSPTGEYRLLVELRVDVQARLFVFTIGSTDPPRHIGFPFPDAWEEIHAAPVLIHGSLHWYMGHTIMVFDTTAESFRQMRSPVVSGVADLFQTGGTLGIASFNRGVTVADIWAMEDYEGEVWAFKQKVELPVAELGKQFGEYHEEWCVFLQSWDGDFFGLAKFAQGLLHIDMDGKVVASFHGEMLGLSPLWLKQTLVQHAFFGTLEGYVVNGPPFI
ncbi:F-box only protein 8-like [Lolium perenne]|jgi:F-box interacting protein|uniref:F-box only protein 8-like n=1 Tax=Lolium perenne TaxID=4522 RepID=UPI0021EB4DD9|nr:F-box protein At5g49610-like [Lolium perenne]